MTLDPRTVYLDAQRAILELVTDQNQHISVPACPAWTLRDLVAHQIGVIEDFTAGNLEGAPGDSWSSAHIGRFADLDLNQVKAQWIETINQPQYEEMVNNVAPDVVFHEFDVRGAVGNQHSREADRVGYALQAVLGERDGHFRENTLPALEIITDGASTIIGEGDPRGRVTLSPWEATRLFTGRRSPNQVRQLDWSTDPTPWLDHLSGLGSRDSDLIE